MDFEGLGEGAPAPPMRAEAPEAPYEPDIEEEHEDAGGAGGGSGGGGGGPEGDAAEDDTANFVCSVCLDDEAEDDNPIIMCDGGCGKGALGPEV